MTGPGTHAFGDAYAQALRVYLLNEADLTFLHSLEVSEEDFSALKAEQGILVDFGSFPAKLVSLLEKCIAARVQDPPRRAAGRASVWPLRHNSGFVWQWVPGQRVMNEIPSAAKAPPAGRTV